MRKLVALVALVASATVATSTLAASAHEAAGAGSREIAFPKLPDGRFVLTVDLHTHSVFSDGSVWPDIRVEEARRDRLHGLAVTEHLEYQPKSADIPHPDRNRAFELAKRAAQPQPGGSATSTRPLEVINGAEITKFLMPPGHINAVFITDANALMGTDPKLQLEEARKQGAFVFWNHPYWYNQAPDGVAKMNPLTRDFIRQGLIQGIEVANGADMADDAFRIAIDNKLTILGTSDIHGLVDWDYDLANGGHRTATLVLADAESQDGMKTALKAGKTVAIYNGQLAGLPEHVGAVVRGTLTMEVGEPLPRTSVVPVKLTNTAPIDYLLENTGAESFYDEANVLKVRANSSFTVMVKNVPDRARLGLSFRVLNTWTAPRQHLDLRLGQGAR
jgi:3',5'-nucleoside bisphosphate phosphatase